MIMIMKNCNDFQVHRCTVCMRELEAAKDQGSSRPQTSHERSCLQCKGNSEGRRLNAVQYWSLPSIFSLWTLFKCQYHSSNSSSCFFCYNGQPLQIPACSYQATRIDNKLSWKPHVQNFDNKLSWKPHFQNFDNKLSWKPHVHKVKTQLSRACGILSKLKHYTTPPVLKVF